MQRNFFLALPTSDDAVLALATASPDWIEIISKIVNKISNLGKFNFYYDSEIIKAIIAKINQVENNIQQSTRIRSMFKNYIDVAGSGKRDDNYIYIKWTLTPPAEYAPALFAEAIELALLYPDQQWVVVNIHEAWQADRAYLIGFKDAPQIIEQNHKFIFFHFITNEVDTQEWVDLNIRTEFSLTDTSRFRRTSHVQHGKPVFYELENKYYWYLDNFHKNEYEVFNSDKQHIGVANLSGEIDHSKAISGRSF